MKKINVRRLCRAAMIAALYVALTMLSAAVGLSSGAPQVRLSEALCVLPLLMPEAVAGVTVGCLLANIITGGLLPDILIGTLATLIGAVDCLLIGNLWRTGTLFPSGRPHAKKADSSKSASAVLTPDPSPTPATGTRADLSDTGAPASAAPCRKRPRLPLLLPILGSLPTVLANTLLIPPVLRYAYHLEGAYWLLAVEVAAGELISCTLIGSVLILAAARAVPRLLSSAGTGKRPQ